HADLGQRLERQRPHERGLRAGRGNPHARRRQLARHALGQLAARAVLHAQEQDVPRLQGADLLNVVLPAHACTLRLWISFESGTASSAPPTGAARYTQKCCSCPLTSAGAIDRAGFMLAPQIGPANMASKATTPPTAAPAMIPVSREPELTPRITNIRISVSTTSSVKLCSHAPPGSVAPRFATLPNSSSSSRLAASAPASCAAM